MVRTGSSLPFSAWETDQRVLSVDRISTPYTLGQKEKYVLTGVKYGYAVLRDQESVAHGR
jgi:hypothetical protein